MPGKLPFAIAPDAQLYFSEDDTSYMTTKNDTMKEGAASLSKLIQSQKLVVTTNTSKVFNKRMVPIANGFSSTGGYLESCETSGETALETSGAPADFGLLGGSVEQQNAGAIEVLRKNRKYLDTAAGKGRPDGVICKEDLVAAIQNLATSPELKAACRYMLENPRAFKKLETALSGGPGDDKIDFGDLDYVHAVQTLQKNRNYLDIAAGNGSPDRLIEKEDLVAAMKNPATSPELKEACKYLLGHPSEFLKLETTRYGGPGDNKIDFDDLDASGFVGKVNAAKRDLNESFHSKNFLDTTANIDCFDKLIGKEHLIATLNDQAISPELQKACKHLLKHADDFGRLATVKPSEQGGKKSCSDSAGRSDQDLIGLENLKTMMNNPACSSGLKEACKYLLEHIEEFCRIEAAQHSSGNIKNSGLVSKTMKAHLSWSKF